MHILDRIFTLVIGHCFGTYIVYIAYLPPHPLQQGICLNLEVDSTFLIQLLLRSLTSQI
jgi:hypothetical protein